MATALTGMEPILTPKMRPALPRQATDLVKDLAATNDFSDTDDDDERTTMTFEPDEPTPAPDGHARSTSRRALADASASGVAVARSSWAKPILGQGSNESRLNILAHRAGAVVRKSFTRRPSQPPLRRVADENAAPAAQS